MEYSHFNPVKLRTPSRSRQAPSVHNPPCRSPIPLYQVSHFGFSVAPGGTAHPLSCPQGHWLACHQTVIQERHTEAEQTNSNPRDIMPNALLPATQPINVDLIS